MAYLMKSHPHLSYTRQCGLLSVNRSGTYYKIKPPKQKDVDLLNEIRDIWERCPFYGYRRIHATLKHNGIVINRKKVRRLMKVAGLQALYPKPKTSIRNKEHRKYPYLLKNYVITAPNQVWATDITYIKLPQGHVYLIAILDVYSRCILSWRLSNSLSVSFCMEALAEALEIYGAPDIVNTDQGCQFTSDEWIYTLVNWGVFPSMTGVGRCSDNIYSERFWRTLKYENTYIYSYGSMIDARQKIKDFIQFYNHERLHQCHGYKTPMEVYNNCRTGNHRPDGYVDSSLNTEFDLSTYPQALYLTAKNEGRISLI